MTADQHSFTARLKPGSPREGDQHVVVQVFAGRVLESGLAGTRSNAGELTLRVDEAQEFIDLLAEHERVRVNRVVHARALQLELTLDRIAVREKARELHDASCKDMPDCPFGVTGTWFSIARKTLADEAARTELGLPLRDRRVSQ